LQNFKIIYVATVRPIIRGEPTILSPTTPGGGKEGTFSQKNNDAVKTAFHHFYKLF